MVFPPTAVRSIERALSIRIGLVQTHSCNDLDANLEQMESYIKEAVSRQAQLICFPEMAYFTGRALEWSKLVPRYAEFHALFSEWAKKYQLYLLPGTLREPDPDSTHYFNTQLMFDPEGKEVAHYRKLFLFKANLPERKYEESGYCTPGKEIVVSSTPLAKMGMSICFDVRFPELYRKLKGKGAEVVFVPASFTVPTGKAHWEVLLRARAIENQVFIVAPGMTGEMGDGAMTYGHSLIINPWGEVLCDLGETPGMQVIDVDLSQIADSANKVSAWECRRDDIF